MIKRVANLDRSLSHVRGGDVADLARAFVDCLAAIGFAGVPDAEAPVVDPADVDDVVARSSALGQLQRVAPWLDSGPTGPDSGHVWIATTRPPWRPAGHPRPRRDHFTSPALLNDEQLVGRPIGAGLHTSSSSREYLGMWSSFLDLFSDGVLWGRPWTAWRLSTARPLAVAQITGAQDWAALVQQHGTVRADFLHPDWASMTSAYDAVHVTPTAVCAIEGLALETSAGVIRPMYWSVESTLWLRWCFDSVKRVAEWPGPP